MVVLTAEPSESSNSIKSNESRESRESDELSFDTSRVVSLSLMHVGWADSPTRHELPDARPIGAVLEFDAVACDGSDEHQEQQEQQERQQQHEQQEQHEQHEQHEQQEHPEPQELQVEILHAPSSSNDHQAPSDGAPDLVQRGSRRQRVRRRVRQLVNTMCCIN